MCVQFIGSSGSQISDLRLCTKLKNRSLSFLVKINTPKFLFYLINKRSMFFSEKGYENCVDDKQSSMEANTAASAYMSHIQLLVFVLN